MGRQVVATHLCQMNEPSTEQSSPKPIAGVATDFELISRFAKTRDEDAFRGLVERHGPMVPWVGFRRKAYD